VGLAGCGHPAPQKAGPAAQVSQAGPPYLNTQLDVQARVEDLVRRMTLEEKISQLVNEAPAVPRLGIPAYNWWNECLHGVGRAGVATVFPQAIGMAASFDRDLMFQVATVISDEARAKHQEYVRDHQGDSAQYYGLTFWTPNINIFRDPRWGRGQETYGEDPYLTGQMGIAFVKGLQGNDPHYLKALATAKHFAVHSGPEPLRHSFNAVISDRDLFETYLPAFRDLVVEAKVGSIMSAYNRVDGQSATAHERLLGEILRGQWGFEGYVVSDCGAVDDIYRFHKIVATGAEAAGLALSRGVDLECGNAYGALPAALRQGLITEDEIDTAVKRLFTARMRLGMFDPPDQVHYTQIPITVNDSPEHSALARAMAQESIVLLKNSGLLPLRGGLKTLAVIGPTAQDVRVLHGNYEGKASHPVTVLEGIKARVQPGTEVLYSPGCELVEGYKASPDSPPAAGEELFAQAVEFARKADVTIFVGGLSPTVEGEEMFVPYPGFKGGDRTDLNLPQSQHRLLKALHETGKPVVLVLMSGSALAVTWEAEALPAILQAWYPGQQGGNAIADVLFGDVNPGGRLPVTFYRSVDQVGDFNDYRMEGKTYRYFRGEPLYPFGYGLSYTRFEYTDLKVSRRRVGPQDSATVTFKVTNTGSRDGEEVVQLYVRDEASSIPMPVKQLRGFQRIALKKGQGRQVRMALSAGRDLSHYDERAKAFAVEPGGFEIQVGSSSQDIRLRERIIVR
jgi:beta-glucosidase